MEQTTAGKGPPIQINSGGPIQILNPNAVRGGAVGPRMISITPQMLNRPGQPVLDNGLTIHEDKSGGDGDKRCQIIVGFSNTNEHQAHPSTCKPEYKINSQNPQSFTNDPLLHSQFVQYAKNHPLSQKQDQQQTAFVIMSRLPENQQQQQTRAPFQIQMLPQQQPSQYRQPQPTAATYYNNQQQNVNQNQQNHSSNIPQQQHYSQNHQQPNINRNNQYINAKPLSSCSYPTVPTAASSSGPVLVGPRFHSVVAAPQQIQTQGYSPSQLNNNYVIKSSPSCRFQGQQQHQQSTQQFNGYRPVYGAGYNNNINSYNNNNATSNPTFASNSSNIRFIRPVQQQQSVGEIRFSEPYRQMGYQQQQMTPTLVVPSESGSNHPQNSSLIVGPAGGHYPSNIQPLKPSQYIAHIRNSSPPTYVELSPVGGNQQTSVIRPTNYAGGGSNVVTSAGNNVAVINSSHVVANSGRNNYANSSNSAVGSNYYNGGNSTNLQASALSAHHQQSSSSVPSGDKNGCNNSSSGYSSTPRVPTSTTVGGELTLQSFLSNPSAPFMCPPSSSTSSGSGGSGYYNNDSWGEQGYVDQEQYALSSCQYSDAMRRNNAPITLQALSGLPPGANHLLVKTENGQFQLVSVRMQSPTAAAAPGTPIPSTVAAPPTSMSIAQQLPSSSPLVPPPPPPHSAPSGPPMVPPISSSLITTTTIPPHPSQQGRIITSSSSNHIVTSWSSSNSNSLVNNSSNSSPHPILSSSAAPLPPPHIAPPPLPHSSPHPSSVPSSVIMPPNLSASSSQLLMNTANNVSSSTSSSTLPNAAQAAVSAVATAYQQRTSQTPMGSGSLSGVPPPPPVLGPGPPPTLPKSIPSVIGPSGATINNLPPGASVIRTGVAGPNSLPPPPPVMASPTASPAAGSVTSSSLINSIPPSPTGSAVIRPQSNPASQVPNNTVANNASGMGMMMTSSNSMSGHPHHQIHPQYSPVHPSPSGPSSYPQHYVPSSYSPSAIASSNATANTVSQMSNETAKNKCKNFLSFLLELSAKQNQTVARNVKNLIQGLIDGKVNEESFADRLQREVNSQPQPCLVGFLKKSLPHLRQSLATNELRIEGIKPPARSTLAPPAPVSALLPQTPPTPTERKQTPPIRPTTPTVPPAPVRIMTPPVNSASPSSTPPASASSNSASGTPTLSPSPSSTKSSKSKGSSSKSKSGSAKAAAAAAAAAINELSASSGYGSNSSSTGPGGTPSTKSSIPSSKSSKEKEKKDKSFLSSGYSADDDINDVAAMGGVNLAEESQRILGSTEYVGTQIRSCRDETMIQASPILQKFKVIAAKYGLDEVPTADVSALLSHAVEERIKTMIEKLSVIAEHRMDVIKLDERYEITQDVRGQLRFLEELDKLEKKRHDEQEREMLIKAAKSRSKSEDPEQAKLKAKAKEMQRVALEEMRQRDANLTALQAIGPRKKPKLDTMMGSHGSTMPSPLGATGASSSLGRPQMSLRPRLKRVNLRDLLFLLEHDKETMRSPFLYRNLLLK